MPNARTSLIASAAAATLGFFGARAVASTEPAPKPVTIHVEYPTATTSTLAVKPHTCFEDEPCWDCKTMGNRVCGKVEVNLYRLTPDGPLYVQIYDESDREVFTAQVEHVVDERDLAHSGPTTTTSVPGA